MTGRISVNGIELRQPGDEEPIAVGRANLWAEGHVPQGGVTVHHPYQLLAGSLQQHLLA